MAKIKAWAVLLLLGLGTACSQAPRVSTLYSNIPELALYAEIYNASQTSYRIIPEFHGNPQELLMASGSPADMVAGNLKMPPQPLDRLASLDFIFDRSGESRKDYYEGILNQGQHQGVQVLLPLSFNLPLIIGQKDSFPEDWPGVLVEAGDLIAHSSTQNRPQKSPPVLGYSLRWSNLQVESLLFSSGWTPALTPEGALVIPPDVPEAFFKTLTSMRDMNGGSFEDRFTAKYLPGQGLKLLSDRRVIFYPSTLRDHLSLPTGQLDALDFRFPALAGKVWATDDPVMLAFPRGSRQPEAAGDFAAWLMRKKTQIMLLETSADLQLKSFGIAGGLSSLYEITEEHITRTTLELTKPVPGRKDLIFPPALSQDWSEFTGQVLHPWISKKISGTVSESLRSSYEGWKAQKNVDTR